MVVGIAITVPIWWSLRTLIAMIILVSYRVNGDLNAS